MQRPGDNRWSMTIFARDADTGMAKWVYQMTPHDEWDYDGVNEMILADIPVKGEMRKALVHFDRNGFGYTLDRETGELLVAEKYDPAVNWATHVDMETARPAAGGGALLDPAQRRGRQHHQHLPGGARHQGPAAGGVQPEDRPVLRADQPRLHGLRAVPGQLHRRPALCRRHVSMYPAPGGTAASATSSPGTPARARSCGRCPSRSRSGRARWPPPATWCSTARSRAT